MLSWRRPINATANEGLILHHLLVHEGAAFLVLDLDDPDVGIEFDLPREIGIARGPIRAIAQGLRPDAFFATLRGA